MTIFGGLIRGLIGALIIYLIISPRWGDTWGLLAGASLLILAGLIRLYRHYLEPRLAAWTIKLIMHMLS